MLKIAKIILISIFTLMLLNITVFANDATNINMNLMSEEDTNTIETNNAENNLNTEEPVTDDIGGTATPSNVSSIAQENMSFSNILNILIITVGIILILLAIAILIRLKS